MAINDNLESLVSRYQAAKANGSIDYTLVNAKEPLAFVDAIKLYENIEFSCQ